MSWFTDPEVVGVVALVAIALNVIGAVVGVMLRKRT